MANSSADVDEVTVTLSRISTFRWYFVGRFVGLFGSAMAPIALAFAVLEASDSAGHMSVILAAQTIPMVLFALVGGMIGDRYPRRVVLMVTNLGACLTQAAVALVLASGHYDVRVLAVLAFLSGCLTAGTQPALRGIVPEIVPKNLIRKANSVLGSARNVARIFGPTAGAVIVARFGGEWAIAVNAASYLVAAFCLANVWVAAPTSSPKKSMLTDLREGWTEFSSRSWVWAVAASFTVTNFLHVGVWTVLGPLIARDTFGVAAWGVVLSANAAGMLITSVMMYRLKVTRLLPLGLACVSLMASPLIVLGMRLDVSVLVAAALLAGMGVGVYAVAWETSLQEHIPRDVISRVSSYDNLGSFVAIPLGQLAAAPLAAMFGATRIALYSGIFYLLFALAPLAVSSVRNLRHDS